MPVIPALGGGDRRIVNLGPSWAIRNTLSQNKNNKHVASWIFGKSLVVSRDNFVSLSNGRSVAPTEVSSLQLGLCEHFFDTTGIFYTAVISILFIHTLIH